MLEYTTSDFFKGFLISFPSIIGSGAGRISLESTSLLLFENSTETSLTFEPTGRVYTFVIFGNTGSPAFINNDVASESSTEIYLSTSIIVGLDRVMISVFSINVFSFISDKAPASSPPRTNIPINNIGIIFFIVFPYLILRLYLYKCF